MKKDKQNFKNDNINQLTRNVNTEFIEKSGYTRERLNTGRDKKVTFSGRTVINKVIS